jgi:acetyl/propionyl-CoA carboxylase alpha subunit
LKASAGGGGKGMRVVRSAETLTEEIEMAKGEAKRNFGNDNLLIEKYLESCKHIEVLLFLYLLVGSNYG